MVAYTKPQIQCPQNLSLARVTLLSRGSGYPISRRSKSCYPWDTQKSSPTPHFEYCSYEIGPDMSENISPRVYCPKFSPFEILLLNVFEGNKKDNN